MSLVYRDGTRLFKLDESQLPPESRRVDVINDLYYALFKEFAGAAVSKKYKHLNNQQKMEELNKFAENWLKERQLL